MNVRLLAQAMRFHLAVLASAVLPAWNQASAGGVRGVFDFPLQAAAVAADSTPSAAESESRLYEVTVPVSFRTTKGDPTDVLQIEAVLTLQDDRVQILAYEPRTTLSGDVVGEIEETVTTEDARGIDAAAGASIPIPGLEAVQIGPSVNWDDSERTVRTEKQRRKPRLAPIIVAGYAARGRGVFFQLRPAADVSLEGAHHLTLHVAAPADLAAAALTLKCRATAVEDWIVFEREAEIAAGQGQVKLVFLNSPAERHVSFDHTDRPCPICDTDP